MSGSGGMFEQPESHGLVVDGGLLIERQDPQGALVYRCTWEAERLRQAEVTLPGREVLFIEPRVAEHPILGLCDRIRGSDGAHIALSSSVNWARPENLPAVDVPGRLPAGAGTAILNLLSMCAVLAGVESLRYRGPYPTGRLFDSLLESFTVDEPLEEAFATFSARLDDTLLSAEVHEPAVEFRPDPFQREWPAESVCVQRRREIERVFVSGAAYARGPVGACRLRDHENGLAASVYLAGEPWADVLHLSRIGEILEGPHPLPPPDNAYVGKALPATVRTLVLQTILGRAPELLHAAAEHVCADLKLRWGDPGPAAASLQDGEVVLHAVLPERLEKRTFNEALSFLVPAVEPIVHRLAQVWLADASRDSRA